MDIGGRIRAARKRAGLSQEEVARRAGMSLNGMANIERGLIPDPHISSVRSIADALGVPVGELLGEPVLAAPKADAPPPPRLADDVPQTMGRLLERAGADGRELALPLEDFKRLYDGISYEEAVRLNRKILAQRRAIDPILRQRLTMPPSEDRSTLYRLWEQALARMFFAAGVHTAMAREAARAEADAAGRDEIMRLAEEQASALTAAAA